MTAHRHLDDDARERAALYALGAMAEEESDLFSVHLAACGPCRAEVESLREPVAALAELAPAADPPLDLKERLLARVRGIAPGSTEEAAGEGVRPWRRWAKTGAATGFVLAPASSGAWEPTGYDGVEARKLFVDEAADRVTMLVRMAPGAAYPPHRHGGAEECYVIEGDLAVGDVVMSAGDYQRAEAGFIHGVQSTRDGCLLLVVSSLHDQVLSA